jgi:hypothetical protein
MPPLQILVNLEATDWSWNCDLIMFAKGTKLDCGKTLRIVGVVMLRSATDIESGALDTAVSSHFGGWKFV